MTRTKAADRPWEWGIAQVAASTLGGHTDEDPADIEWRNLQMLFRALNTRRVIAVVGSGLSRGYGYLDWDALVDHLVISTFRAHHDVVEPELDWAHSSRRFAPFREPKPPRRDKDGRPIGPSMIQQVARAAREELDAQRHLVTAGSLLGEALSGIGSLIAMAELGDDIEDSMITRVMGENDRATGLLELCDQHLGRLERCAAGLSAARGRQPSKQIIFDLRQLIVNALEPKKQTGVNRGTLPMARFLKDLEIRRFLTLNYDDLIEKEIEHHLGVKPLSIVPTGPDSAWQLTKFAVSHDHSNAGVLHLHGSVREPDTIVATENDYRRIYVDPSHERYREGLRLVLETNPILFIGVGMGEADVLRPFRELAARRRPDSPGPAFALLRRSKKDPGREVELGRFLLERYGVRAIFHDAPNGPPEKRSEALGDYLKVLSDGQRKWWSHWQRKPYVRRPDFSTVAKRPESHAARHLIVGSGRPELAPLSARSTSRVINELPLGTGGGRVLVVLGGSGSGKGSVVHDMAAAAVDAAAATDEARAFVRRYDRAFVTSFNYTNDVLSTIEGAATHFARGEGVVVGKDTLVSLLPAVDRLYDGLVNGLPPGRRTGQARSLLVIGGLDRVLVPGALPQDLYQHRPTESRYPLRTGSAATPEIEYLLKRLVEATRDNPGCDVVLLSGLVPTRVGDARPRTDVGPPEGATPSFDPPASGLAGTTNVVDRIDTIELTGASRGEFRDVLRVFAGCESTTCPCHKVFKRWAAPLHFALDGHVFLLRVLSLVARQLCVNPAGRRAEVATTDGTKYCTVAADFIEHLTARLHAIVPAERPAAVVNAVVEAIADDGKDRSALREVLSLVSRFTNPVSMDMLCQSMGTRHSAREQAALKRRIKRLAAVDLLLKLPGNVGTGTLPKETADQFVTHSTVRNYSLARARAAFDPDGEPQRLGVVSIASEISATAPGSGVAYRTLCAHVDETLDQLELRLNVIAKEVASSKRPLIGSAEDIELKKALASLGRHIRATFGIVRSSWSATSLGRLWTDAGHVAELERKSADRSTDVNGPVYADHLRRLARLTNLVRLFSATADLRHRGWSNEYVFWERAERDGISRDRRDVEVTVDRGGALLLEELMWLYNELAVLQLSRGAMFDAYALYRQVEDCNGIAERNVIGHRWHELEMSFGAIKIERGQLDEAFNHVQRARRLPGKNSDRSPQERDLIARSRMYEGEVMMLRGNYTGAERQLLKSEKLFDKAWSTNHRGSSLCQRRLGDLYLATGRADDAERCYFRSLALAESGRHFDLAFFTRVRREFLSVTSPTSGPIDEAEVRSVLGEAERFARVCGIARLEFEVHQVGAELSLRSGNLIDASKRAQRCLAITAGNGLSLRVTTSLVLLARIRAAQDGPEVGAHLLHTARARAQYQKYQQEMETIERELIMLRSRSMT